MTALSVLEAVGRGAEKPSEIAARLGTAQTNSGPHVSTTAGCLDSDAGDSVWRKPALDEKDALSHSRPGAAVLVSGLFAAPDTLANLQPGGEGKADPRSRLDRV